MNGGEKLLGGFNVDETLMNCVFVEMMGHGALLEQLRFNDLSVITIIDKHGVGDFSLTHNIFNFSFLEKNFGLRFKNH
jgi:hypothetical protein